MMEWHILRFSELDTYTLYALLQLRVDVFVVEQNCPYPELDEKDLHPETRHILLKKADKILGYSRILPPGVSFWKEFGQPPFWKEFGQPPFPSLQQRQH